jgi:hypothetical protein
MVFDVSIDHHGNRFSPRGETGDCSVFIVVVFFVIG